MNKNYNKIAGKKIIAKEVTHFRSRSFFRIEGQWLRKPEGLRFNWFKLTFPGIDTTCREINCLHDLGTKKFKEIKMIFGK